MNIQAKEILILTLGVIATLILTVLFENNIINLESFSSKDVTIITIIAIVMIIYVLYKRIEEIDNEINNTRKEHKKLEERLKIHNHLINIEAKLIALERKNGKSN